MAHPFDEPSYAQDEYAQKERADSKNSFHLNEQEVCVSELLEVVYVLQDRLHHIMTPQPEVPTKDPGTIEARVTQSPIAERVDKNNANIRKATRIISSLIERAEV